MKSQKKQTKIAVRDLKARKDVKGGSPNKPNSGGNSPNSGGNSPNSGTLPSTILT
jgi:hypothetical protein